MKKNYRLKPMSALFATAFAAAALAGCGEDGLSNPADDLCCTDFEVGADMSNVSWGLDAEADAKFSAFAQAGGDLSAVGTGALNDMFIACQNIALDLGADIEDLSVQGKSGRDAMEAWCTLAVGQINASFGASGEFDVELDIAYEEPKCSASFSATVDCQGSCDVNAMCDIEANPPVCEGGELSVECEGSCSGEAGASISCTGECTGECSGSCKAEVGATVACEGKCDGECTASASGGTNDGLQADGTCKGECSGTCELAADAKVECSGTCSGTCSAECKAQAGVKFECDAKCDAEASPPKCSGGELKGGCEASADCQASCNASASAKAECTPPSVSITYSASAALDVEASIQLDAAIASLEANLPNLLIVLQARGEAFVGALEATAEAGVNISGEATGSVKAVACATAIISVVAEASANFEASLSAAASVAGSLQIGG